jgi:hypothetical protein
MWDYISYGGGFPHTVTECVDPNWKTLAEAEPEEATAQMTLCLQTWKSEHPHGGARLFSTSILDSPRVAVVPEFVEDSWATSHPDSSTPNEKTIQRFRVVFLHALNFSCSPPDGCEIEFVPGAGTDSIVIPPPSKSLDQLTGFLLPIDLPTSKDAVDAAEGTPRLRR